jgi:hypothetical protein
MNLTESNLNVIFDTSIWENFRCGYIKKNDISKKFKIEKDCLNELMREYIFAKHNNQTTTGHLIKTTTGYTFSRECNKRKNKKCKSCWKLQINIRNKSAHLDCKFMCNHIESSIKS